MTSQQDYFSSYRLKPLEKPQETETTSQAPENEDVFSKYRKQSPEEQEEEGFFSSIPRHATRISSRVAETIGGLPGDISDLLQSGVFYGLEKTLGLGPVTQEMREEAKSRFGIPGSSAGLKEASEKLTKGYTTPQTETEKLVDDYAETVASLLGPMKFRKALGVAAVGSSAKKGVELLGGGDLAQEGTKIGTMLVASMFNPKGVKQLYSNYYNEALHHAPEGAIVSAKPLEHKLNILKKKLSSGIEAPTEKAVLDDIAKVKDKIKDGKVSVREMMATNRSINERMGDPELLMRGKNLYPELKKAVNDSIKLYKNPEFSKAWKSGNEAFAGLHESQKLSRFITKHIGNKPITHVILAGIGEIAAGYPEAVLPTIAGAGAAFAGVKGIELGKRISSNPTLRKYYRDVLLSAAKEDSVALTKSADNLTKEIEKNP